MDEVERTHEQDTFAIATELEEGIGNFRTSLGALRLLYDLGENAVSEKDNEWFEKDAYAWVFLMKCSIDEAFKALEELKIVESKVYSLAKQGGYMEMEERVRILRETQDIREQLEGLRFLWGILIDAENGSDIDDHDCIRIATLLLNGIEAIDKSADAVYKIAEDASCAISVEQLAADLKRQDHTDILTGA